MMKNLLTRLPGVKALPDDLSYDRARAALEAENLKARRELAARTDAPPETLYYLAGDAAPAVRRLAAANPSTPRQADALLADDVDEEVRCELARKIARLIPELGERETGKVRDLTLQVLDRLSQDQLPRVRAILAQELKSCAEAPQPVVLRLARDVEEIVAAPILEYSPLLSDDDLIELVTAGLASGLLEAVARRSGLPAPVSDSIAATYDVPAIAALLRNTSAEVRAETLDQLAEQAEAMEALHEPLALRPDLSLRAVRRIAGFVAAALVEKLAQRNDLDDAARAALAKRVRAKVETAALGDAEDALAGAIARVERAAKSGGLTEAFVLDALEAGDAPAVRVALAALARVKLASVDRILAARAAKPLVALVWKAGLSMRAAGLLQERLAGVAPKERLAARGGVDFPMAEDEMVWLVEYFAGED